jgi:hypothetical protein
VQGLELGGWEVAEGAVQAVVVKPAEVLDDRQLELLATAPDAIGDQLGLEAVDERFGQSVIQRVADGPDRLSTS